MVFEVVHKNSKPMTNELVSIMVSSKNGFSAIMELILFEGLYFEVIRGIVLLIAFSFSIAEIVA